MVETSDAPVDVKPGAKAGRKSTFARSQPTAERTKARVQRAKSEAPSASENRSSARRAVLKAKAKSMRSAKAPAPPRIATGPAAKNEATAAESRMVNKAAFVRSQPLTAPAKVVVAEGAKLGLEFSTQYVHKIRSVAKAASRRGTVGKGDLPPPGGTANNKSAELRRVSGSAGRGGLETTFRRLVVEIGLERARSLIDELEKKLGALIGS